MSGTNYALNRATIPPAIAKTGAPATVTTAGNALWLRASDTYQYQGTAITMAQFMSLYSAGDLVEVEYKNGAAAASRFNLVSDAKPGVPGVTTAVAAGTGNVTLTVTPNADARTIAGASSFQIQRRSITGSVTGTNNTTSAWADVASVVQASTATTTHTDAAGTGQFEYRVRAVNPVSNVASDWVFVDDDNGTAAAASRTVGAKKDNNAIDFDAVETGVAGNGIRVSLVANPGTATLSVNVVDQHITVNLVTNVSNVISTTAAQVITAVNADAAAKLLVEASNSGASTGAGVVVASSGLLTGGVSDPIITPAPATDLAAASALRTFLVTNQSPISTLSQGDVVKIVFNRPMLQPAAGATIVYGGLTLSSHASTGNATFSVNTSAETVDGVSFAAGRVLTITMTSTPASNNVFGAAPLNANATAATGILPNTTVPGGAANTAAWNPVTGGNSNIERDTP